MAGSCSMLLQVSLGYGISLIISASDWKSVGQGLAFSGMRVSQVMRFKSAEPGLVSWRAWRSGDSLATTSLL